MWESRKNTDKRGQSSVEFLALVGAVIFFFIIFLLAIQQSTSDEIKQRKDLEIKEIALSVQNEIVLATEASEGYSRNFQLPQRILGAEYEINLIGNSVFVRTKDGKHALSLPIANVTGDLVLGENTIRKNSGEVFVNL